MSHPSFAGEPYHGGNYVVDALPEPDRARIAEHLVVFEPEVPDCMVSHGEPFQDVLFPIDAIFSVTAELRRGNMFEVAAIGRQGLIGSELALGVLHAPRSVMAQVGGRAARMSRDTFAELVATSPALAVAVQRHFVRRLFIAEQFVACNFVHSVIERCARWLLMLHDEIGREEFGLRGEFLGMMLGLEARGAIEATRPLQQMDVVGYHDEYIALLDLARLREVSCECYEAQRRYVPFAA